LSSYLEWALEKLSTAPVNACAFWVDPDQLLSRRNGGGLEDREQQAISDSTGRSWTVVRYLANPLPGRRLLYDDTRQVVVWCIGTPGRAFTDLTPFEDFLGRAWSLIDIGIEAIARETRPDLELPRTLGPALKGIAFDPHAYIEALADEYTRFPITPLAAANVLVRLLLPDSPGIDTTSPGRILVSSAICLAKATGQNDLRAVHVALDFASQVDARYGRLLSAVKDAEPRDVLGTVYFGSGFARLGLVNIGAVLSAEGFSPPQIRNAFEEAGGSWSDVASFGEDEFSAPAVSAFEQQFDHDTEKRLQGVLSASAINPARIIVEPLPTLRVAAALADIEELIEADVRVSERLPVGEHREADLKAIDMLIMAVNSGERAVDLRPPASDKLEDVARAFAVSPLATANVVVARGHHAFKSVEHRVSPATVAKLRARLQQAEYCVIDSLARWDGEWARLIAEDTESYLNHQLQGWKRTVACAESEADGESWMIVLDGLRFDLWKTIVAPAVEAAGWRAGPNELSLAFLPSLTEVSRRTLIGGSPTSARGNEQTLAQALATKFGLDYTYAVRTEHVSNRNEVAKAWNVRVFSWPDKFVHSDLADLGTLAAQFENWVKTEFIPWLRTTIPGRARLVISTDHGFATLDPGKAIDVDAPEDGDRNLPRVLRRAEPSLGLVVGDGGQEVTVATSDRWFRSPGGRHWHFAHGGCTIHETLVPFAELVAVREGEAEITISGLPENIEVEEGEQFAVEFVVRVVGGGEMFPRVTVRTNVSQVLSEQIEMGAPRVIRIAVSGVEGLSRMLTVVTSGSARKEQSVPVRVKLQKLQRTKLDMDI
jgi:hypothetical protein